MAICSLLPFFLSNLPMRFSSIESIIFFNSSQMNHSSICFRTIYRFAWGHESSGKGIPFDAIITWKQPIFPTGLAKIKEFYLSFILCHLTIHSSFIFQGLTGLFGASGNFDQSPSPATFIDRSKSSSEPLIYQSSNVGSFVTSQSEVKKQKSVPVIEFFNSSLLTMQISLYYFALVNSLLSSKAEIWKP